MFSDTFFSTFVVSFVDLVRAMSNRSRLDRRQLVCNCTDAKNLDDPANPVSIVVNSRTEQVFFYEDGRTEEAIS